MKEECQECKKLQTESRENAEARAKLEAELKTAKGLLEKIARAWECLRMPSKAWIYSKGILSNEDH